MRRRASILLAALVFALLPVTAVCEIYEFADADGKVKYYKYTDKRGGVVFSDRLAGIPDEYRRTNRIVRIGPPPAPAAPAAPVLPADQAAAPAPGDVKSDEPPATGEGNGGFGTINLLLGVVALLAVLAVTALALARRKGPSGIRRVDAGRDRGPTARPDAAPRRETPQEALHRHLSAGDFASAAQLCESLGRLGDAAGYHREAGNLARARELYVQVKDYRNAAELFEKAGDDRAAAELYEALSQREVEDSRGVSGGDSARKSGQLFEKIGETDRALAIYLKARLFAEAGAVYEQRGDFLSCAESLLLAGDAEKAAAFFERAGDPARGHAALSRFLYEQGSVREAAEHAVQAGDPVQAATLFLEVGDLTRAGELYLQAGFFDEAAENLAQAGALPRAAEAFEKAGKHLQAARALEQCGGDQRRIADLYERGGEHYSAGRLFVRLGDLDRALAALQRIDASSEQYGQASLLVGMIFLKRGMNKQAAEKFTRVIGGRPVSKATLEPYYFLALCHDKDGDAEHARSIFEKILAEDYNFRDVRRRVAGVEGQG